MAPALTEAKLDDVPFFIKGKVHDDLDTLDRDRDHAGAGASGRDCPRRPWTNIATFEIGCSANPLGNEPLWHFFFPDCCPTT